MEGENNFPPLGGKKGFSPFTLMVVGGNRYKTGRGGTREFRRGL